MSVRKALEEVLAMPARQELDGPMFYHDIEDDGWTREQRAYMAACVNLVREHGQALATIADESDRIISALEDSRERFVNLGCDTDKIDAALLARREKNDH